MFEKTSPNGTGGLVWNRRRELEKGSPTEHVDNDPFGPVVAWNRKEIHAYGFVEPKGSGQHCGRTGLHHLSFCFAAFALEAVANIIENSGFGAAKAKGSQEFFFGGMSAINVDIANYLLLSVGQRPGGIRLVALIVTWGNWFCSIFLR